MGSTDSMRCWRDIIDELLTCREIKNTIRSAQALAVADGTELNMKHITTVLQVQKDFKEDFEGFPGMWNGMGLS